MWSGKESLGQGAHCPSWNWECWMVVSMNKEPQCWRISEIFRFSTLLNCSFSPPPYPHTHTHTIFSKLKLREKFFKPPPRTQMTNSRCVDWQHVHSRNILTFNIDEYKSPTHPNFFFFFDLFVCSFLFGYVTVYASLVFVVVVVVVITKVQKYFMAGTFLLLLLLLFLFFVCLVWGCCFFYLSLSVDDTTLDSRANDLVSLLIIVLATFTATDSHHHHHHHQDVLTARNQFSLSLSLSAIALDKSSRSKLLKLFDAT